MENIESIEMASFKSMMLVADKMQRPEINQMLLECFNKANEDKALYKEITKSYLYLN